MTFNGQLHGERLNEHWVCNLTDAQRAVETSHQDYHRQLLDSA
jgi:hypothetical protein